LKAKKARRLTETGSKMRLIFEQIERAALSARYYVELKLYDQQTIIDKLESLGYTITHVSNDNGGYKHTLVEWEHAT